MSPLRSRVGPWLGLFMAGLAWAAHHQLGSQAAFGHCLPGQGMMTALLGAVLALVCLAGGWLSMRARGDGEGRAETRRFAATLSACGAGLFGLAILYQTTAALVVPVCLS